MEKRFKRKRSKIAGVCEGLGEYFDMDPVLFRAMFLVGAFLGTIGIWIYIFIWILTTEE